MPGTVNAVKFDTFSNVINGKTSETKETRTGFNPATKEANPPVPVSTKQDLDNAVAAARAAFKTWRKTPVEERKKALIAWADAIAEQKSEFASYLVREQGKPLFLAESEIDSAVGTIKAMTEIDLPKEEVKDDKERAIHIRYTPLGVVGAIVPWNFPIQLLVGKVAPAVVTGNTIVCKPSPFTPYCGLKIVELAQSFFPPGVINAVSGDDNLGPWITSHPDINKISFTGSTATGKKVMESCSKTLKRITLELGGKDPAIICGDVDVAKVAPQIATFAFLNSGQICIAMKRIYVHSSIYDAFRDAMVAYTKTLKVGEGNEAGVFLGPIQNEMQYERVKTFFDDVKNSKQKVATGGTITESKGYFISPTIIDNPAEDSKIVQEEPFGPIVPLLKWDTEEEVIARANNTEMGLGASVWSKDIEKAERIGAELQSGSVWINEHLQIDPLATFGGHKSSGIGSEWGQAGLKSYCNAQAVYVKKNAPV